MATRKGLKKVKVSVKGYKATRYKKKATAKKSTAKKTTAKKSTSSSRVSKLKARNSYIQKTLKAKKLERIKLINKGLKAFPSSKAQKDIQKKITAIENKIKSLEKEYYSNDTSLRAIKNPDDYDFKPKNLFSTKWLR
jgi:predicted RNase H-like nuclease (RuvC/YqgF family)